MILMIIDTHCHVYKSEMENAEEIIRKSLKNDIFLETDSPYMAPQEKRDKSNVPFNLKYVILKLCDEFGLSEEEIIKTTTGNARVLFGI